MKYSVLMSVYIQDEAPLLEEALFSVFERQTKKPDEIVVVFDGPLNDELYAVLDRFAADKEGIVKYIRQETNLGLGEALRVGTQHCTGDYIFRMDADDISDPARFEKQSAFLEAHPEVDVLGADIAEFVEDIHEETVRVRACPQEHAAIAEMARRRNPMNHVSVCMRREALVACGGYEEVPLLEDYYLWLKMIVGGYRLANLHESLVYVRLGRNFNEKRGSKRRVKGWRTLQDYMIEHKMIGRFRGFVNMLSIYGFVYCPSWVRKLAYSKFLRG